MEANGQQWRPADGVSQRTQRGEPKAKSKKLLEAEGCAKVRRHSAVQAIRWAPLKEELVKCARIMVCGRRATRQR